LNNYGNLYAYAGSTLNLTTGGIPDIRGGSTVSKYGTINGWNNLGSVEGTANFYTGSTSTETPGSGTLTVSRFGIINQSGSTLSVTGNVDSNGTLNDQTASTLNVSGLVTNEAHGALNVYDTSVANLNGGLNNLGSLYIATGATVNLPTGQGLVNSLGSVTLYGTLEAGAASGIANLTSVQNTFNLYNTSANSVTPNGGTLTVGTSATLNLNAGTSLAVTGNISNQGGISNQGTSLTDTGIFLQKSGYFYDYTKAQTSTLSNAGGTLDVFSGGLLTVGTGSGSGTGYDQLSTGVLDELISSSAFGLVGVSNAAVLNGTLNIQLQPGYTPLLGSTFDIMNFTSEVGTFATVNGVSINGSEHFRVDYNATNVTLTVVAGAAPTRLNSSTAATPEPASIILLGSGLVGILARRRRTRPAGPSV
jgi:hypothetical protein